MTRQTMASPPPAASTARRDSPRIDVLGERAKAEDPMTAEDTRDTTTPSTAPDQNSSSHVQPTSPVDFISSLFHQATTAVETTIEQARREMNPGKIAGRIVGVHPPIHPPREKDDPLPRNHERPKKVTEMKMLRTAGNGIGLQVFMQKEMLDIVVVGSRSLEAFEWDGSKVLQRDFSVTPASKDILRAECATYLEASNEVAVAHVDGIVKVYDMSSGNMGTLKRSSTFLGVVPSALTAEESGEVLVGGMDGTVRILDKNLQVRKLIEAPCSRVGVSDPGVQAVVRSLALMEDSWSGKDNMKGSNAAPSPLIARSNGMIDGDSLETSFCAHAEDISGVAGILGCIILTAGTKDCSIAAFLISGVCVARKYLEYPPTTLRTVRQSKESRSRNPNSICPSEHAFLVGGANGQVEVFRCVVYGPSFVELKLVRRISTRQRGPRRAIRSLMYSGEDSVIIAVNENGDIRRWRMTDSMAAALSLTEVATTSFNENNVKKSLSGFTERKKESRLANSSGVVVAQRYMSKLLREDLVKDANKDLLVERFQKCQADMQGVASEADVELRRTAEEIVGRFFESLHDSEGSGNSASLHKCMSKAGRRIAAVELGYAVGQHAQTMREIEKEATSRLGIILMSSIKSPSGEGEARADVVRQMREQVESLSKGELVTNNEET